MSSSLLPTPTHTLSTGHTPPAPISPHRLLNAPLPDLLAEAGATLADVPITDSDFFGAVYVPRDGGIVLAMPEGRPAGETDRVARELLGRALAGAS